MGLKGSLYLNKPRRRAKPTRFKVKSLLWLMVLVPALWFGYREVKGYFEQPQAMLVLGGDPERESFAAKFARQHPDLPIWVSGGSPTWWTERVFSNAGIDLQRLHIDHAAADTVTNFTTLVDEFRARRINSVYLITSDQHMRRARVIGEIVFGSRGIYLKPVSMPSQGEEPFLKTLRDGARAIFWIMTGHTGTSLSGRYESH